MKISVMIPTYNESENIEILLKDIIGLNIENLYIVVVDDNSPDHTADIVNRFSKKHPDVNLLLRTSNKGRGSAGKAGFQYCLDNNSDIIIEMDADLSHNPKDIPKLLEAIKEADLVLGSRLVPGGRDGRPSVIRKMITVMANFYIRTVLGLKVKDCNSGFRCFRRKVLEGINVSRIESRGPDIVQEVLYKASLKGFNIREVPITLIDRSLGKSKLGIKQLLKGYTRILELRFKHLMGLI